MPYAENLLHVTSNNYNHHISQTCTNIATHHECHVLQSPCTRSVMCNSHHAPWISCTTDTMHHEHHASDPMHHGYHVLQPPCMWLSPITATMSCECYALFLSQIKKLMLKQFQRLPRPHLAPLPASARIRNCLRLTCKHKVLSIYDQLNQIC